MVLHEHVFSRDADTAENSISIVLRLETKLRANVTCLDSSKGLKGFRISDRDNKDMNAVLFTVDN